MIAIIDYGLGNLGSIHNMMKAIGENSKITSSKDDIEKAHGLILPGVGAFDAGMTKLVETGLNEIILNQAKKGKPILGICLGMQLLGRTSEEGCLPGLSLIPFDCKKFIFQDSNLKIPHMGWDVVDVKKQHPITCDISCQQRYYFVHSYYAVCDNSQNILMTCNYGHIFAAAVEKENIIGVQFHPEKSHNFGLALFSNYAKLCNGGI